jgi:hypothetical protein
MLPPEFWLDLMYAIDKGPSAGRSSGVPFDFAQAARRVVEEAREEGTGNFLTSLTELSDGLFRSPECNSIRQQARRERENAFVQEILSAARKDTARAFSSSFFNTWENWLGQHSRSGTAGAAAKNRADEEANMRADDEAKKCRGILEQNRQVEILKEVNIDVSRCLEMLRESRSIDGDNGFEDKVLPRFYGYMAAGLGYFDKKLHGKVERGGGGGISPSPSHVLESLRDVGVVEAVVRALESHAQNPSVQRNGLKSLQILCLDDENRRCAREMGAVCVVRAAIEGHPGQEDVQLYARKVLKTMYPEWGFSPYSEVP